MQKDPVKLLLIQKSLPKIPRVQLTRTRSNGRVSGGRPLEVPPCSHRLMQERGVGPRKVLLADIRRHLQLDQVKSNVVPSFHPNHSGQPDTLRAPHGNHKATTSFYFRSPAAFGIAMPTAFGTPREGIYLSRLVESPRTIPLFHGTCLPLNEDGLVCQFPSLGLSLKSTRRPCEIELV